jgi:2'-5' RNA ligase
MADTVRTFFAVDVAPSIHAALVDVKRELGQADAAVRWVRDEGLHATIKFLGRVPEPLLPAVRAAVSAPAAAMPVLAAHVRGLGVFPSPKRPRVIWAGIDCTGLDALAAAIDAALEPLGFASERRAFAAHITLGRVNGTAGWARLEQRLREHWCDDFGRCEIAELAAYRSDLRRDGAVYTKLWTIPFGGSDR